MSILTITRRLRKPALIAAAAYTAAGVAMAAPKLRQDYRAHHRARQQRGRQPVLNMSLFDRINAANRGNVRALTSLSPAELTCATPHLSGRVIQRLSAMGALGSVVGDRGKSS